MTSNLLIAKIYRTWSNLSSDHSNDNNLNQIMDWYRQQSKCKHQKNHNIKTFKLMNMMVRRTGLKIAMDIYYDTSRPVSQPISRLSSPSFKK